MKGVYVGFANRNRHSIWPEEAVRQEATQYYPIPEGTNAFTYLFQPVLDKLGPLYWYAWGFESTPFVSLIYEEEGGIDRLESLMVHQTPEGAATQSLLYAPGTLPDLAPYLYDDWVYLVGLDPSRCDPMAAARRLNGHRDNARSYRPGRSELPAFHDAVEELAEMCFICVDGISWELYAHEYELVSRVVEHLRGRRGFDMRECELRERGEWGPVEPA